MSNPNGHNGYKQRIEARRSFVRLIEKNNISLYQAGMILGIAQPILKKWIEGDFPKVSTISEPKRALKKHKLIMANLMNSQSTY